MNFKGEYIISRLITKHLSSRGSNVSDKNNKKNKNISKEYDSEIFT